ncbi:hypothetical protein DMUE_1873 [Dictyocoela muelleri]|nr:hypothetical protein DMUE_1873 [Dictyocoela muelleri]
MNTDLQNPIDDDELTTKILKIHSDCNHRKTISDKLENENIYISKNMIDLILKGCDVCFKVNIKYIKSAQYIKTTFPGEIFAFDLIEIKKDMRIIVAIDYFSRFVFEKS